MEFNREKHNLAIRERTVVKGDPQRVIKVGLEKLRQPWKFHKTVKVKKK